MLSLPNIRQALANAPVESTPPTRSMAAVALALAGEPDALELCFILRATRPGDRWSAQMALPGGKAELGDPTLQAVAVRETREEVGLNLEHAEALGGLATMALRPLMGAAGNVGTLSPFAFYVGVERPPLRPQEAEVAEAFWISLAHLWDPRHRDTIDWEHLGQRMRFPGIRFGEHVIWGLTHRVLMQWAEQLGRPLPGAGQQPLVRS